MQDPGVQIETNGLVPFLNSIKENALFNRILALVGLGIILAIVGILFVLPLFTSNTTVITYTDDNNTVISSSTTSPSSTNPDALTTSEYVFYTCATIIIVAFMCIMLMVGSGADAQHMVANSGTEWAFPMHMVLAARYPGVRDGVLAIMPSYKRVCDRVEGSMLSSWWAQTNPLTMPPLEHEVVALEGKALAYMAKRHYNNTRATLVMGSKAKAWGDSVSMVEGKHKGVFYPDPAPHSVQCGGTRGAMRTPSDYTSSHRDGGENSKPRRLNYR
jgi:hypothetical protein